MFHTGIAILTGMKLKKLDMYKHLCLDLNMKSGTVSGLVSGKDKASLKTLQRLADYFNVPLSTFILWGEQSIDINKLEGETIRWQRSADRRLNGSQYQNMVNQ